jgi:NADP-dependent 3-hydroxy acid dehydrogenase YdfG
MTEEKRTAAVVGVGPGTGAALARRFATGYRVALIARNADYLSRLAAEIGESGGEAIAALANVAEAESIEAAFASIKQRLGNIEVLLYNAAMRPFGRLMETKASTFENTWRVNAFGAFLCAQQVVPAMLEARRGVIIFTGATAGTKPFPTSAAFGPAKFALRGLAQVMARDLGPQGIHVAYVNIDGGIDMPFIRKLRPEAKDEDLLRPSAIAEAYWHVAHQDRSAWTQELDLRPFKEAF